MAGWDNYLDKWLAWTTQLLGGVLLGSVGLNFYNAFMRYVIGSSLVWAEEIMVFTMIFIVMMGAVLVALRDAHLRIDVFAVLAPPAVQKMLRMLSSLLLCLVCGWLAVHSHTVVSLMLRLGQKSVAARLPMWLPHSFVLAFMVLMALAGACLLIREIMGKPLVRTEERH